MTESPPPGPPGDYPPPAGGYYPYPPPAGGYYPPAGVGVLPTAAYTPWSTRVVAFIIDGLPVGLLTGIGQVVMFSTGKSECVTVDSDSGFEVACNTQPTALGLTVSLIFSLVALAYVVWNYGYRQGTTGSSIGKSLMKFTVVSEKTGRPIGFGLSIVRQLAHIVDALICYIGYLFPLWDAKRQTIADKIMTTVCLPIGPPDRHA